MKKNYMKKTLLLAGIILGGLGVKSQTTFNATGAMQTYTVPAGVTGIKIESWGAKGSDHMNSSGGLGGYISGEISVTPGEVLNIYVGDSIGFNGGGAAGGAGSDRAGVIGGGASDVRQGGTALTDRVVVAGGGGGSGRGSCDDNNGGGGGYPGGFGGESSLEAANTGGTGTAIAGGNSGVGSCAGNCSCSPGGGGGGGGDGGGAGGNYGFSGGINTIGGTGGACGEGGVAHDGPGGTNTAGNGGCFGLGGDGGVATTGGGGGGGGWYGGGAGGGNWGAGGGGGSSYVIPAAANLAFTNNTRNGNGQVVITPLCTSLTVTVSDTILCTGETLTVSAASTTGGTVTWNLGVLDGIAFTPPTGTTTTYTATSTDLSECIFSIDITVITAITGSVTNTLLCNEDSIIVNGTTYNATNLTGTEVMTATSGCDSTVTVSITVPTAITGSVTNDLCNGDSIIVNGTTYNTTNLTGTEVLTAANGCDSIVTVNITVMPAIIGGVSNALCNGDSIIINGTTYNTTNLTGTEVMTAANGCDSTVTVNITVMPAITGSVTSLCDGDSIVINGTTYNATNLTGTEVLTAANGCDSTVAVNITVLPQLTGVQNQNICFGDSITINGTVYNAGNLTGTEVFTGVNGCDSTVTITVTIENQIDTSTTTAGLDITANQTGATYQWVDCNNGNTPIAGETNTTYTATATGDYAVVITMGMCSDTSACVSISTVGIDDNVFENNINIYPNPTNGAFTVLLPVFDNTTITVYSVVGQQVSHQKVVSNNTAIDLTNNEKGIYLVKITNQQGSVTKRIIKQ